MIGERFFPFFKAGLLMVLFDERDMALPASTDSAFRIPLRAMINLLRVLQS